MPAWFPSLRLQSLSRSLHCGACTRACASACAGCAGNAGPHKRRGRSPGSKNKPKPPKTVPAEVEPPAPEPQNPPQAAPPTAPAPAPEPVEPVRMTPAQERAHRYMQRADRYMELLARNTHEF